MCAEPYKIKLCKYLKSDFIEVEAVAHVVVGADRFRVIVHHDCFATHLHMYKENNAEKISPRFKQF